MTLSPSDTGLPEKDATGTDKSSSSRRLQPIAGASTWDAYTFRQSDSWIRTLTGKHIDEIDRAISHLSSAGLTLATVRPQDLRIPGLEGFLADFLSEDVIKRGFGMIRGFPVGRYSEAQAGMFFWALGSHMGKAVSQNANGDRLGSVRNQGLDYDALNVRGYQTRAHLPFHCDPSDVVGLLCINKAKRGGLSSVVSGTSMYNRILAERPQYLDLLYRGFRYDRRGEEAPYQEGISGQVPVFSYCGGDLSIRYVRKSMETAQLKLNTPFTAEELEVLDYMEELSSSPDLVYSMMMEPGDMQFCNNYTVLHSRTGFEEQDDPARKRHMMRLWIKVPGIRHLAADFIEYDEASGWSRREGIPARGAPMPKDELAAA
jgi:hypothetical protein